MREKIVNKLIIFLKKYKTYTNDEEEILKYGFRRAYDACTGCRSRRLQRRR